MAKCSNCGAILKDSTILNYAAKIVRQRLPARSVVGEIMARTLEGLAKKAQ